MSTFKKNTRLVNEMRKHGLLWPFLGTLLFDAVGIGYHSRHSEQGLLMGGAFIFFICLAWCFRNRWKRLFVLLSTVSFVFYSLMLDAAHPNMAEFEQIIFQVFLTYAFLYTGIVTTYMVALLLSMYPATFLGGPQHLLAIDQILALMTVPGILAIRTRRLRELAQERDRYRIASITDSLTGLYVLHYLLERVQADIDEGKAVTVLLIDMNKFKQVNDTYGHWVGNQVLVHATNLLRRFLEGRPGLIGRLGGDEFVIFLLTEAEQAPSGAILRQELTKLVTQHPFVQEEGVPIPILFSVGIVSTEQTGLRDVSELLQAADREMYEHKNHLKSQENPMPQKR